MGGSHEQRHPISQSKTGSLSHLRNMAQSRRERLLVEDIPFKEAVCDDCLLVFWEDLMATEPGQWERGALSSGAEDARSAAEEYRNPSEGGRFQCKQASTLRDVRLLLYALGQGMLGDRDEGYQQRRPPRVGIASLRHPPADDAQRHWRAWGLL
jgi:hypothetical protein